MPIVNRYAAICDECADEYDQADVFESPVALRRQIRKDGWATYKQVACPACSTKWKTDD